MTTPMLELRAVVRRFGDVTAVDRVDLSCAEGEFLTLLGPSGCGKTTILRLFAGFERPDAGQVMIDGSDVGDIPPHRRPVNQVFQNYALFPHLSVGRNVAFGLEMKRIAKRDIAKKVAEALELADLRGLEKRMPSELSGGQKQRVALARALVLEPKVLLLDEPLSALDARLRKTMQIELKHLQRRLGITFLFVTHDQEEALTMSDRIAVMNGGRIVEIGTARDIYRRPKTKFVAEFVGETNLLRAVRIDGRRVRLPDGTEISSEIKSTTGDLFCSVRPEAIGIGNPGEMPPHDTAWHGIAEIRETIFCGSTAVLKLETRDGQKLTALTTSSRDGSAIDHGASVPFFVNRDDIAVVLG
jgi:spermidine/putrescine transport system ATP-binding protein